MSRMILPKVFPVLIATASFLVHGAATRSAPLTTRQQQVAGESELPHLVVQQGTVLLTSAVISPTGRFVLTSGVDLEAVLWETRTGREIRRFRGSSIVQPAVFSPDEKTVMTVNGFASLWDITSGGLLLELNDGTPDQPSRITCAAFSPDGKLILTGSGNGNKASLWEASTGRRILSLAGHDNVIQSVAYAGDGTTVAATSPDGTGIVWAVDTGRVLTRFAAVGQLSSLAYSKDGRELLFAGNDKTVRLVDVRTGAEIRRFVGHHGPVHRVAISPDGRLVASTGLSDTSGDDTARLWDTATGKEIYRFDRALAVVSFSGDGRSLLVGEKDQNSAVSCSLIELSTLSVIQRFNIDPPGRVFFSGFAPDPTRLITELVGFTGVWDLETGRQETVFNEAPNGLTSVAFSDDGRRIAVASNAAARIRILDAKTEAEIIHFDGVENVTQLQFTPDGLAILTGNGKDDSVSLWNVESGIEIRRFPGGAGFALSYPGRLIATSSAKHDELCLWDLDTGSELRRLKHDGQVMAFGFSPNGRYILSASRDRTLGLWETASGRRIRSTLVAAEILSLGLSPKGGRYAAAGDELGTISIWDLNSGTVEQRLTGHSFPPTSVAFSADESLILSGSLDGSARLWNRMTGKEVCRLFSFSNGTWIVTDPDGHFDTNNLEEIRGLSWIMPDDPLKPLPLEVFMRDYYEPRLLPRLLNGETFNTRSMLKLNRVQPEVAINEIVRQNDSPELVTVTVKVKRAISESQKDANGRPRTTGVYDVRLFRDGQIVGQYADGMPQSLARPVTEEEKLLAWRSEAQVKLDANGERTIKFENIKLPQSAGKHEVQFTAYAFNEDRVKSETAKPDKPFTYDVAPEKARNGRAYIISIGVNAHDNPAFDLKYSVNDANAIQQMMFDKLSKTGAYAVVQVPLSSDYEVRLGGRTISSRDATRDDLEAGQKIVTSKSATKSNLKAVLDVLAGKRKPAELPDSIPDAAVLRKQLQQAQPEDLVLVSFSGHGYADTSGTFYFVLSDTGKGKGERVTGEMVRQLLPNFVSSEELSLWLLDVDAGEMLMIVDACHSAAAVAGGEFKPGPMGSRGLGQLSYDKGMRILTATQAEDVAYGSGALKQGLLTYVLVKDGIEAGRADFKPKDGKITVSEWLEYGEQGVPKLLQDATRRAGQADAPVELRHLVQKTMSDSKTQRPSLFDFARKRPEVLLVKR